MKVYPEFKGRKLYLTGEGQGAHFAALFANVLYKTKNKDFNLAGVILASPWIDPFYQLPAHNQFAVDENIITPPRHFVLKAAYEVC